MTAPASADPLDPSARLEIAELLARYAEAIDDGDFDAVGRLLADAVVVGPDGQVVAEGARAITSLYEHTTRRHADGTPRTAHVITNVIIEPLGPATVEVRSRFTVLQATESVELRPVIAGRYVDRVELLGQRWRFTRREMRPELVGDLSDHLLIDLDARAGSAPDGPDGSP